MFKLVQTCGACPEQYDVFLDDKNVGYMRLCHGYFYAECCGERVYESKTIGDGLFEFNERDEHLKAACKAIKSALMGSEENLFEIVRE